jgi:O-antigen/teichoic acid export membrane protein
MTRRTSSGSVLRSIGGVGGAAAFAQAITLLSTPFVSRLFTEAELGRFGLFFSLANVLVTLALLGLTDAMIAAHADDDADTLLAAAILSTAIMSPILGLATFAIVRFRLFGYGELPLWTAIPMTLEVAAISAIMILQAWLIRIRRFRLLAAGHLVLGGLRGGGPVIAGFTGLGFFGLVIAELASRVGLVAVLGRPLLADLVRARARSVRHVVRTVWRYRIFPIFRTPSTFANNLGTALPPTLVAMVYGVSAAGSYTLMSSVLVAPTALVQRAVGDVFLGHFSEQFRHDPEAARRFLVRVNLALLAIALAPSLILLMWGEPIFALVFGAKWRAAGTLASIMAPALLGELSVGPLGAVLNVVNRPDAKLLFDLTRIAGYGGAYLIATTGGLPLTGMVSYLAVFSLVSYSVYAVLIHLGARYPRAVADSTSDLPAISA